MLDPKQRKFANSLLRKRKFLTGLSHTILLRNARIEKDGKKVQIVPAEGHIAILGIFPEGTQQDKQRFLENLEFRSPLFDAQMEGLKIYSVPRKRKKVELMLVDIPKDYSHSLTQSSAFCWMLPILLLFLRKEGHWNLSGSPKVICQ